LRLRATWRNRRWMQQTAHSVCQSLDFIAWMAATASAVQTMFHWRGIKVFLRKREFVIGRGLYRGLCWLNRNPASHPKQPGETVARRCYRFRIESIANIHPCADAPCAGKTAYERERHCAASARLRPCHLRDGSKRQAGLEQFIQSCDTGRRDGANDPWAWGQRRRDAVRERGFDLEANCGGGSHRRYSPYFRLTPCSRVNLRLHADWCKSGLSLSVSAVRKIEDCLPANGT
jgi:hypothetical protein